MFFGQVGFVTWLPITLRMGNDFMPTEYRALAVMLSSLACEILTFIGALAFPYGDKALGSRYFYILGTIALCFFVKTIFIQAESKGKLQQDILEEYEKSWIHFDIISNKKRLLNK